ncbi:hypothetical protein FACS1894151_00810 [Spirochaetia bacterium]|nr:hypothetical protein FACS1894151_00810 [Spirochaetia bacterium]
MIINKLDVVKILVAEYKTKAGKTFDQCPLADTYEAIVVKTDVKFSQQGDK